MSVTSAPGRLLVMSGPSGVGKSTIAQLLRGRDENVWLSVSATTRAPRPGEVDGQAYFFMQRVQFDAAVAAGDFLEHATFDGNMYGTPRNAVMEKLDAGVDVVLEIDLAGARQVRASMPEALLVFIAPPSWEVLQERLIGRGTEPPEVIHRRLEVAKSELAAEAEFDVTIVNEDVNRAVTQVLAVLDSQRSPRP